MATCSAWKIIFNSTVLPEIYFSYSDAMNRLRAMIENTCAGFGRVVSYDNETGEIGN